MLKGRIQCFLIAGLITLAPLAQAAYRCTDTAGRIVLQDAPCAVGQQGGPSEGAPDGRHFLWKANTARSTLYLLGSIHFGQANLYPLPDVMIHAFEASSALVVEADITATDPETMAQRVAAEAMYPAGVSLEQKVGPEVWQSFVRACKTLNVTAESLQRQKPWMAALTLNAISLRRNGYSEKLGIDQYFLRLAHPAKRIIELESFDQQLGLLDSLSEKEQVLLLKQTLQEVSKGETLSADILQAWQAGNAARFDDLINESFSGPESAHLRQVMFDDRNAKMSKRIAELMEKGGTYFVVVGAGHLVGKGSIIERLTAQGYQLQQM